MKYLGPTYIFLIFALFCLPKMLCAQFDNAFFIYENTANKLGDLELGIENQNFFKNNEYFNDLKESYTMGGYYLNPSLQYQVNDELKLKAGACILNFWGRSDFQKLIPSFNITYDISRNLRIEMGNLQGAMTHRMEEQMYSFDRQFENYDEQGIRVTYDKWKMSADLWLDWQYLSFPLDSLPEQILGGFCAKYDLMHSMPHRVGILTQASLFHEGGQYLAIDHTMESHLNALLGYEYQYSFTDNQWSLGQKSFIIQYADISPEKQMPYILGYGWASEFSGAWRFISAKCGYWNAHGYYSPVGETLFSTVSEKYTNLVIGKRHVVYAHLALEKKYKSGFGIGMRSGLYLSPETDVPDYYFGVFMVFMQNFKIL